MYMRKYGVVGIGQALGQVRGPDNKQDYTATATMRLTQPTMSGDLLANGGTLTVFGIS
jgi:hypothetical protein